jgi:hypothetical protein
MCVAITMEPGTHLTLAEIQKMGKANGDGIGLAFAHDGIVDWWKTLNYKPEYIEHLLKKHDDMFRLVHFRLSTAGGIRSDLCHPFEVGPEANSDPRGHSTKVLIHNGHWHRWTDVFDILKKEGLLPDTGPWSDTRLMAYLTAYDPDWLDVVGGKVAILDGQGNITRYGDWLELRPGIKVSNKTWDHDYNYTRSGKDRQWEGWGWTSENWMEKEKHQKALAAKREEDEKEAAKGTSGKTGPEKEKAGEVRVAVLPDDSNVSTLRTGAKGAASGPNPGKSGNTGHNGRVGAGDKDGQVKGQWGTDPKGRLYDRAPWQEPATKKWYRIHPDTFNDGKYRTQQISETEAYDLMEQIALASAEGYGPGAGD